jgi:hypothetical protein
MESMRKMAVEFPELLTNRPPLFAGASHDLQTR